MRNLALILMLSLVSYSLTLSAQETGENGEQPEVTNHNSPPASPTNQDDKSTGVDSLDQTETLSPVSFDLRNLKPSDSLNPESTLKLKTQLDGFSVSDFNMLPSNFKDFMIRRTDSPADRRFLESIRHDDDDDGPRFGPKLKFKDAKPFQDLVDAYNNRPLKFKINRIKGITDLTGHKVRGSSGWKIEISIPLN
mgnify:CR=1 FL=1